MGSNKPARVTIEPFCAFEPSFKLRKNAGVCLCPTCDPTDPQPIANNLSKRDPVAFFLISYELLIKVVPFPFK